MTTDRRTFAATLSSLLRGRTPAAEVAAVLRAEGFDRIRWRAVCEDSGLWNSHTDAVGRLLPEIA